MTKQALEASLILRSHRNFRVMFLLVNCKDMGSIKDRKPELFDSE
jgi:hypothetical protein